MKSRSTEIGKGEPKRWSYSAWSSYDQCNFKYYLGYIAKAKQAKNWAMERGSEIHKMAEYFLKGEIHGVPKKLKKLTTEFKGLQKAKPIVEKFWNADKKFREVGDYKGWVVLKADAALPPKKQAALVIDHKSGKAWPDHIKQAELSAVVTKGRYPETDGVDIEFWYIDQGEVVSWHFNDRILVPLKEVWTERGEQLMSTRKFLPMPSQKCQWCPFRSDKGGPCKAWKKVL